MKKFLLCLLFPWIVQTNAAPLIPELPLEACSRGTCTEKMTEVLQNFVNTPYMINKTPAVYSGECHHLNKDLSPDTTHYAEILIDDHPEGRPYFSSIFAFFFTENPYASWDLTKARERTTDNWRRYGTILESQNASRVEVRDDEEMPVNAYYMRQDPSTQTIYYITYFGFAADTSTSFCTLTKNP